MNPIQKALADAERITEANQAIVDQNIAALNAIGDPKRFQVINVTDNQNGA